MNFVKRFAHTVFKYASVQSDPNPKINKVLVVSKLSRYEYERSKRAELSDSEFEQMLSHRGTDYVKLKRHHKLNKKFESTVISTLEDMGMTVEVCNRFNYTVSKVDWADLILPTGGDGTFLLAASKVRDYYKPVMGFNSDPSRSEGHLCLPKKYSGDIREAVEKIQTGSFDWLWRNRIRITLQNPKGEPVPTYLHEADSLCDSLQVGDGGKGSGKILPALALNEVLLGETMSARVSHLQMRLNGEMETTDMKCSGVCICTGTGSTSWNLNINRLPLHTVVDVLKIIYPLYIDANLVEFANKIAEHCNDNLKFSPDDARMGFSIRDMMSSGVWPNPKGIQSRGFAEKIEVKSSCFDASLVVDGGVSFPFNDGTTAILEIRPEDALRTVVLHE